MLQCLPVKKNIVRIAHFSFLIALITCSPSAVRAQSSLGPNTVIDVKEDRARGSAVITTALKKPLPRPIIQFLPGDNGNTTLVADFNDVAFPGSTKVIPVSSASTGTTGSAGASGIKLVRIGRFQDNPPVFRVAIVSNDVDKLRNVNFVSGAGSLVIKWPKSTAQSLPVASSNMPPAAPNFGRRRAYQTNYSQPSNLTNSSEAPRDEIPQVSPSRSEQEAGASNGLGLRPAMPEPTIDSQEQHGLKIIREPVVELSAKPSSLSPATTGGAKVTEVKGVPQVSFDKPANKIAERKPEPIPENSFKQTEKIPPKAPQRVPLNKSAPVIAGVPAKQVDQRSSETEIAQAGTAPQNQSNSAGGAGFNSWFNKVKEKTKALLAPENSEQSNEDLKEASKAKRTPSNIDDVSQKNQLLSSRDDNAKTGEDSQSSPVETKQPPTVGLTPNSSKGYTIKIVSADKSDLNFTSFRLHNPERFVIDLQDQRGLSSAVVPQPDNFDHLKAIRVGAPDPTKNTGRLVLDLAGENVAVIPGDTTNVNEVSFVIGEAADPVAGLSPPPGSVLVLDAGHGGSDPGAQRGFIKEKELTLAIAQKTRAKLAESGIRVIMTRSDDTFVSLQDRVTITNTTKPDMFLSVHINSLESTNDIHGIETYYQTDMSKALAQSIHESLVTELDAPNRNIRKAKFYVVNRAEVPAVLAEVGFISNKAERDKLASEDYQEKIAGALAKGAILYLKQHSAVAGKVNRASDSPSDNSSLGKEVGSTIPRAKSLVHKGLGIKSN